MVTTRRVMRGDIWLCALDPTVGREIRKTRPCLVVSPDNMNVHLTSLTVVPLTSKGRAAAFRPAIMFGDVEGRMLADQMRTVDQSRLKKHLGRADAVALSGALSVLRDMFEE